MKDKMDDFIDGVQHLPPSPRALVRLLELFKQPHQDVHEIVKLLTYDPSFTVEVLKRCNSAYFTRAKPADDMFEAVTRLGLQEIYGIVLAMFAISAILKGPAGSDSHVEILWRHSVAVAVAAGVIAEEVQEDHPTAFTAGLLHDIGKVVLVSSNKDRYAQAVLDAGMFRRTIPASEKQLFGFDHCEVGGRLLTRWELPPNIIAAVRHHHHPTDAGEFGRLAAVVALANLIAHGTGEKLSGLPAAMQNATESLAILGLPSDASLRLLPAMQAALENARALTAGG
jgi:putative nucleotidyltransferase with HDIG domain